MAITSIVRVLRYEINQIYVLNRSAENEVGILVKLAVGMSGMDVIPIIIICIPADTIGRPQIPRFNFDFHIHAYQYHLVSPYH